MGSRVPAANETRNILDHQVVGNKADAAVTFPSDTASILGYLKHLVSLGGLPPVAGPTYWVDYELGADTNDGFSPQKPLKLLSAAITAVLAYQAAATNIWTRCRIFLVGSATPQPAITVLPNMCDIIGIGASPLGDGTGIARIGTGTGDGVTTSASKRGLFFKNIQFLGGDGDSSFKCAAGGNLLRAVFEDCCFCDSAAVTATALNAGLEAAATIAGCVFRRCRFALRNVAAKPGYGIYAGGQFSQNLVIDCDIHGSTAGVYLAAALGSGTVIRNNYIGPDVPNEAMAKGVDDNTTTGVAIVNNHIIATDCIEVTTGGTSNAIGNICNEGAAGARVAITEGNLLVRTT